MVLTPYIYKTEYAKYLHDINALISTSSLNYPNGALYIIIPLIFLILSIILPNIIASSGCLSCPSRQLLELRLTISYVCGIVFVIVFGTSFITYFYKFEKSTISFTKDLEGCLFKINNLVYSFGIKFELEYTQHKRSDIIWRPRHYTLIITKHDLPFWRPNGTQSGKQHQHSIIVIDTSVAPKKPSIIKIPDAPRLDHGEDELLNLTPLNVVYRPNFSMVSFVQQESNIMDEDTRSMVKLPEKGKGSLTITIPKEGSSNTVHFSLGAGNTTSALHSKNSLRKNSKESVHFKDQVDAAGINEETALKEKVDSKDSVHSKNSVHFKDQVDPRASEEPVKEVYSTEKEDLSQSRQSILKEYPRKPSMATSIVSVPEEDIQIVQDDNQEEVYPLKLLLE